MNLSRKLENVAGTLDGEEISNCWHEDDDHLGIFKEFQIICCISILQFIIFLLLNLNKQKRTTALNIFYILSCV